MDKPQRFNPAPIKTVTILGYSCEPYTKIMAKPKFVKLLENFLYTYPVYYI